MEVRWSPDFDAYASGQIGVGTEGLWLIKEHPQGSGKSKWAIYWNDNLNTRRDSVAQAKAYAQLQEA